MCPLPGRGPSAAGPPPPPPAVSRLEVGVAGGGAQRGGAASRGGAARAVGGAMAKTGAAPWLQAVQRGGRGFQPCGAETRAPGL